MMQFIDIDSDHIVAVSVHGRLTDEEFERVLEEMDARMESHEKISFYNEIYDFQGTSIENYFKDLKFGIENWSRFEKIATVVDAKWVNKLSPVLDKLIPGIAIKTFPVDQKAAARVWVKSL